MNQFFQNSLTTIIGYLFVKEFIFSRVMSEISRKLLGKKRGIQKKFILNQY